MLTPHESIAAVEPHARARGLDLNTEQYCQAYQEGIWNLKLVPQAGEATITRTPARRLITVPRSSSAIASSSAGPMVSMASRSASQLRRYCAANRLEKKLGLSFRDPAPDRDGALYCMRRFLERLQAEQGRLPFAAVLERGTRGTQRLHWHAMLGPWIPKAHLAELWRHGWVDIGQLDLSSRDGTSGLDYGYLCKYLNKMGDVEQLERGVRWPGQHRWFHTRGFSPVEFRAAFRTPATALAFTEKHLGQAERVFAYGGDEGDPVKGWWVRFAPQTWWAPPRYAEAMRGGLAR